MLTYATISDLKSYAPELSGRTDEELSGYLAAAERDVDAFAGFWPVLVSGRKFDLLDESTFLPPQAEAIKLSTCAQARYRAYMGPVFFVEQRQYEAVGGDQATSSRASRFGPEMRSEFPQGFRRLTGRFV